nr:transcriptional regulator [uncultured Noviherbaspirillum sp.]
MRRDMRRKSDSANQPGMPMAVRTVSGVGEIVQSIRKQQGLSQLDVSGLAGLGVRFMVDLEKGKETIQMQKVLDVLEQLGLELVIARKGS